VTSMFCGFPVGAVVGGVLCARTIPLYGWQSTFVIGGLLPFLLLPPLLLWLPESIRFLAQGARRNAEKAMVLLRRIDRSATLSPGDSQLAAVPSCARSGIFALFADGRTGPTLLIWTAFFCNLLIMYFLINWLPSALQQAGISLEHAIIATAALNAGGVVGGLTFSGLIDRFGPRRVLTAAYFGAALFVAGIGSGWTSVGAIYAVIAAAGFCVIGAQFGMNALAAEFYPTSLRSTGVGAALGIGRVGAIAGPVVGGALLATDLDMAGLFLTAAAPALLAGEAIFMACSGRTVNPVSSPAPATRSLANMDGQPV
jgi:AAHS family 4-hydroxybenzoate transporter-like MFS transporter